MTQLAVTTELERVLILIAYELQLPEYLDAKVRERYESLSQYLSSANLAPFSPDLYPQGSYALGTTVKPLVGEEFDLDFIILLNRGGFANPDDLYDVVAFEIERSGRYAGMTERRPSCIRITYADEFHMDIVPAVPDLGRSDTAILIPRNDGRSLAWHATNPKGYISWFMHVSGQAEAAKRAMVEPLPPASPAVEKTALQIAVQLVKRHHHRWVDDECLRTASVVLTTITATEASSHTSVGGCLDSVVDALPRYIRDVAPRLTNPGAPYETISEKWEEAGVYAAFCAQARQLIDQWRKLAGLQGEGYGALVALLNDMFGEGPVQRAVKALGRETRQAAIGGRLGTAVGGGLTIGTATTRNRPHTFYGSDETL